MSNTPRADVLFHVKGITQCFHSSERQSLLVLDKIDFFFRENQIIALLGKSGGGKSTLLRIMAGLLKPSSGEVTYRGIPVTGPIQGVSMVFQSFALLPWLTVLQNVELGLEALGVDRQERRARALKTIDNIGLDGFESAYPKELSGGMRQRVGLARALVVDPEVLLMDEPFSALDVLTAETLRNDLLDLWVSKKTRLKGILIVTHNIQEAVLMADQIIVFASNPGHIRAELNVNRPLPRDVNDPACTALIDEIYTLMTTNVKKDMHLTEAEASPARIDLGYRLPNVESSALVGLIDSLYQAQVDHAGPVDLPLLAESLHMDALRLLPLTEALELLDLAKISGGDIVLTPVGETFAKSNILESKQIFQTQLLKWIPLAQHIREILDSLPSHRQIESFFLTELQNYLSDDEAERVLKVIINWGRYAEIFAYDYDSGTLSLENPR